MLFGEFPERVNEHAARTTAMLVIVLAVSTIVASFIAPGPVTLALGVTLVVGFALRVYAGPKYSPFGQISVRFLAERVFGQPRIVSGAPKQFAQCIGLVFSLTGFVFYLVGAVTAMQVTLLLLILAASAEAFLGFCAGCWMYRRLQRVGVIGPDACETCAI